MIQWLLDTNTCIAIMNNHPPSAKTKLTKQAVADVAISAIRLYELQYGVSKSSKVEQNQKNLSGIFAIHSSIGMDGRMCQRRGSATS